MDRRALSDKTQKALYVFLWGIVCQFLPLYGEFLSLIITELFVLTVFSKLCVNLEKPLDGGWIMHMFRAPPRRKRSQMGQKKKPPKIWEAYIILSGQ
ncbi:hypothetical protein EBZ38_07415 [bacterium]|nr:hypothetical protein [bacterium]